MKDPNTLTHAYAYAHPVTPSSSDGSSDWSSTLTFDPSRLLPTSIISTAPTTTSTTSTSSSSSSSSSSSRSTTTSPSLQTNTEPILPPPQRLCKDSNRFKLVKTEFCMTVLQGGICSFGLKCNFAHSLSELKWTKLKERADAGLIDLETYRTRPCFHHVSTGSCPFQSRCESLHDPRIHSSDPYVSWLPNVERMNLLDTTVHIDWNAKYRHSLIHHPHGMPFPFLDRNTTFDVFYHRVCGNHHSNEIPIPPTTTTTCSSSRHQDPPKFVLPLPHRIRLDIAVQMMTLKRSSSSLEEEYMGTHFLYGEMCMVRRIQAFDILSHKEDDPYSISSSSSSSSSTHVTMLQDLSEYDPNNRNHVLVHELAFGVNMDTTKRTTGLYFNLPMDQFHTCTREEEVKYNRRLGQQQQQQQGPSSNGISTNTEKKKVKKMTEPKEHFMDMGTCRNGLNEHLLMYPCFPIYHVPDDQDWRILIENVMKHGLRSYDRTKDLHSIMEFEKNHQKWKHQFDSMKQYYMRNAWPVNEGRELVDDDTPVPPTETLYHMNTGQNEKNEYSKSDLRVTPLLGSFHNQQIWGSFVQNIMTAASRGKRNELKLGYAYAHHHATYEGNEYKKGLEKKRLNAFEGIFGSENENVGQKIVKLVELPKILSHHKIQQLVSLDGRLEESISLFPAEFNDSWAKVKEFYNSKF